MELTFSGSFFYQLNLLKVRILNPLRTPIPNDSSIVSVNLTGPIMGGFKNSAFNL